MVRLSALVDGKPAGVSPPPLPRAGLQRESPRFFWTLLLSGKGIGLSQAQGWGISAIVHIFVLATLAVVVLPPESEQIVPAIESRFLAEPHEVAPFAPSLLNQALLALELKGPSGGAAAPKQFDWKQEEPTLESLSLHGSANGQGAGKGTGNGEGDGAGNGRGDIGFFGTTSRGNSVVFVVDLSGSMADRNRFGRARMELVRSMHRLSEEQKFSVIFFNSHTFPLFHPKPVFELIPATPENKRRTSRWISFRTPGASTNPQPALQLALAMKPDVIFFLTDGEIPPETRETVREANQHGTIVNTIAFQGRQGEVTLRAIAEENGGTYRHTN